MDRGNAPRLVRDLHKNCVLPGSDLDGQRVTMPVKDRTVPEQTHKTLADEQTLAKLLEAAYILQEHNREMRLLDSPRRLKKNPEPQGGSDRSPNPSAQGTPNASAAANPAKRAPSPGITSTLEKIAETQRQIQVGRMGFESALQLVAERVCAMTNAAGAAIGIVEARSVRYRAAAGRGAPALESVLPLQSAMFAACLKTGEVFRSADTAQELLLDKGACKARGIASLIAVPVYHDTGIAGGLELYYGSPNAFTEPDVHTCQLMAGLVAEALVREEEANWRKSLASERAAMLAALEKLQPNLAALVEKPPANTGTAAEQAGTAISVYSCRKCGHQLVAEEQFCGQCGSPRAADYETPNMQSKVASLWHMQEAQKKEAAPLPGTDASSSDSKNSTDVSPESSIVRSLELQIPELFESDDEQLAPTDETEKESDPLKFLEIPLSEANISSDISEGEADDESGNQSKTLTKSEAPSAAAWTSAASTRKFLEQFISRPEADKLFGVWNRHRGDIYLAVSILLVLCVIRWGMWSGPAAKQTATPTTSSTSSRKAPRDAGLSLFDRVLIQVGLAEAPDPPPDKGNPAVQVWVDERTALYYCPGTDLYGKTPKGKFLTQHEAQLDQIEAAYRKPCN